MKRVCKSCGESKDCDEMTEMTECDFDMWLAARRGVNGISCTLKTNMVTVCSECFKGKTEEVCRDVWGKAVGTNGFLSHSDCHDLFEDIQKLTPCSLSDDNVQGLLGAIEKKLSEIHARTWTYDSIVTVSVVGSAGSGKSMLLNEMKQLAAKGFVIVEINEAGHYIRYIKETQKP